VKNVVQLEKFMGQRIDPSVRPYAGVLAECRRLVAERLGRSLAAAVEGLDADLQGRRLKAAGPDQENILVEAQFQLRNLGISVNRRFHEVYEREFQQRVSPEPNNGGFYGTETKILMELSLADDDQIADELLVHHQAKHLGQACEAEFKDLRVRVAHMLGETSLRDSRDPIGPGAISAALKEIVWQLDSPREAKVLLLEMFHHALLEPLPAVYQEINALLVTRKVLPRIRHSLKRDRPRVTARQSAAPGGEAFDETATSGIIHRLFHGGDDIVGGSGGNPGHGSRSQAARSTEAVQALTRLQRGEKGVALGQDNFELAIEQCATDNVLHGLIEAGIGRHLGTVDAIIIDVVAALFDYVFEDPHVPGAIKGLIGRLQIPVLKLAMMDHSFFANRGHPARRLVNLLSQSASAWDGEVTTDSALYLCAEPLVARIQNNFGEDTEVFAATLAELEAFLAEQERKAEAQAASLTGELEQQERREIARIAASDATATYLANPALPEAVSTFIGETWHKVLMEAALANSGDGAEWLAAATTMDDLVWSVLPLRSTEDRQRLVKLLPSLLGGLRSGLEKVGAEDSLRNAFFSDLMRLHAAAVKAGMAAGGTHATPRVPPPPPPPVETEPEASADELQALSRGSWISTRDDQGHIRRLRLSWISPARTMFLFANHEGQRAVALSAAELTARFARGDAKLDDEDLPLLDRVVDQVLDDFEAWR
jgi:uncharacterized protein DUF1631